MAPHSGSSITPMDLLRICDGLVIQQALYAAVKLGVADLLQDGPRSTSEIAGQIEVNEPALYRLLRALATQGVFEETTGRTFANNQLSRFLCTGVPGSVRSMVLFRGSELFYQCFGEIVYSVQTGQPARSKLFGKSWEYLRDHPELARIFDDAMTELSALSAPAIAAAYNFGAHGTLMDVAGGNGILLAAILNVHPALRGVLADQPHVIERAKQRGFLGGELAARASLQPCDFLHEVPSGCRAYLMKNAIVDWNDEQAHTILDNCRRAVPSDGVLLLVEPIVPDDNRPSWSKIVDLPMLVLTGGKTRTVDEHRELLAGASFRLNQVVPVVADLSIIEALPT